MIKKKIYAAYGSNMNLEQMKQRCPQAVRIGTGVLKDYRLEFRGGGVATVIPERGSEVPIVLWEITQGCEKILDIYEGFPKLYVKQETQVISNGSKCYAMAYVMAKEYLRHVSSPSAKYFKAIKDGYNSNEIDLKPLYKAWERSIAKNKEMLF